jgi:hypothetical protein
MNANQIDRISAKILSEQAIPMDKLLSQEKAKAAKPSKTIAKQMPADVNAAMDAKKIAKFFVDHKHDIMMAAEIGALLIPIPGVNVAISTAIAGADAAMYWNEGDKYTAGFIATLTAIPVIGSLAVKIPGVKQLGAKGIAALAKKMKLIKAGKKPALSATEKTVIQQLGKNQKLVTAETSKYYAKKIAAKKAAKTVGKTAATTVANYTVSKTAWNWVYKNTGIQQAEIASLIEPTLKQLASKAGKLKTVESKLSIETIIREEIQLAKEQLQLKSKKPVTPKPAVKPKQTTPVKPKTTPKTSTIPGTGEYTSDDALMRLINDTSTSGKVTISIVAVLGLLAAYKGYRIAKFKINMFRKQFSMFSKNPSGFIKSWKSGSLKQDIMKSKSFNKLSKEERENILNAIDNPQAMTNAVALNIDDMATQFMAGKISAADMKAVLPEESLARYGKMIDKIERNRAHNVNIPKGVTTAAEKPVAKPAPKVSYTMTPKK